MSKEALFEFVQNISADESLEAEVEAAIAGKQGFEAATAITRIGAKYGYNFTIEDLEAQRDELSDEDLEEVAGGTELGTGGGNYRLVIPWSFS
ncbi:MAG TPA: Nif11-like leader peptide family RiPP precursor [Kamptonema sp.]|nr:Nif11-like leader peptide family RiPP precursor [Kamptonema sp.]